MRGRNGVMKGWEKGRELKVKGKGRGKGDRRRREWD